MYYIYHIPGIKIGCTFQLEKRMANQGFTEWEILEEHIDIYVASDRERELQKEYGYRVDIIPYWKSLEHRRDMSSKGGRSGNSSAGGHACRKLTMEQAEEIRAKYVPRKYTLGMLAKEYGIHHTTVKRILLNITYT